METNLNKTYDPKEFESRLYDEWMEKGYFASKPNKDKKPFTIMMPPPNITGQLHMGHALDHTLQDVLIRWKRMQGCETLWLPNRTVTYGARIRPYTSGCFNKMEENAGM